MKKLFAFITFIVITFILNISVGALEIDLIDTNTESNTTIGRSTTAEKSAIIDILNFVALDKDTIGLEDVDFSQLKIGNKIYRYILTESGFEVSSYSYPIMYNENIVLMATSLNDKFQITTYEAELLEDSGLDQVALIYDSNGLYFYDGMTFELVHESSEHIEGRESIHDITQTSSRILTPAISEIVLSDLNASENLFNDDPLISVASTSIDTYYAATVDFVSQNDMNTCWAACVAMLTNTLNNHNYSAEEIAIAYLGETAMENGLTLDHVSTILRGEVNYTSIMDEDILEDCYCDEDYAYLTYTISDENIQWCMEDYRPIVGAFIRTGGNQGHHAVVIDAIYRSAGYIRVCDPNIGRIYSYRDTINEDQRYYGEYTYIHPDTEVLYYMVGQIATCNY